MRVTYLFSCCARTATLMLLATTGPSICDAATLSLSAAEQIALEADPGVAVFNANASALSERSVAAAQLPDPKLKLGAAALPINTFDLDQEPMTQLQLGVVQHFPPGETLEIRQRQLATRSEAMARLASNQRLLTLRDVRLDFLELFFRTQSLRILNQKRLLFEEVLTAARDEYGSGRGLQQDVYRAELELSRLDERISRIDESQRQARARLALWVGAGAYGKLDDQWPQVAEPRLLGAELRSQLLAEHPFILSLHDEVLVAELGVDAAQQNYKPGFTLDVTYGDRSGQSIDGRARSDFLSAMLMVDLPIFREKRQDRQMAASLRDVDAAVSARQDALRRQLRSYEQARAELDGLKNRLELYQQRLLPEATSTSEAALSGFQSGVAGFEALMQARTMELDIELDYVKTRVDFLKAQARLLYLEGVER